MASHRHARKFYVVSDIAMPNKAAHVAWHMSNMPFHSTEMTNKHTI